VKDCRLALTSLTLYSTGMDVGPPNFVKFRGNSSLLENPRVAVTVRRGRHSKQRSRKAGSLVGLT
jgi:hypothetical protein